MTNIKQKLFTIGHLEGVSFLLLLGIAMPLKYIFDMPVWVKIIGSLHGFLFVAFALVLAIAWKKIPLTFIQVVKIFILSFLPFGTFFLHKVVVEKP